jgi:chorismate synthase
MLSYRTAGESHGKAVIAVIEGMPAGVRVDVGLIDGELHRRQGGYGRSGRQKIEQDRCEILSGLRGGETIGSPITLMINNRDHRIDDPAATPGVHSPRPGHADLAGAIKFLTTDYRPILERASARETAGRVAAGALVRSLLREFEIEVFAFVRSVGTAVTTIDVTAANWQSLRQERDASDTYCPDPVAADAMRQFINQQKAAKDTAGGIVEAHVFGCPIGLGSCMTIEGRLDARLAAAVVAIQAFKGCEIGLGFEATRRPGSQVHDEIVYDAKLRNTPSLGFVRPTNNAGGLEGGMSNGMPIVVRGAMKPISTLGRPLRSVDLKTLQATEAAWERSDISAVGAASVILENVVAFEIARALGEKVGGDSVSEMKGNYRDYLEAARGLAT